MKSGFLSLLTVAASVVFSGSGWGQDAEPQFELGFSGANSETISGISGLTFSQTFDCILTNTENPTEAGAQGGSISLAGDSDLEIVGITVD